MEMTRQQQNAVKHRGTTLLVSAGAGSGKTSTLSNRIISRISDPHDTAEIDDFLIVTFTNASAADLSEKIEKAISKCVSADIRNTKALRQLAKIKYANISTISSFCLNVIKQHFQLLDLPAKIRVCDEAEALLLKNQVMTQVIEEKYENEPENSDFFTAVELFSGGKNDDAFVDILDRIHRKIVTLPQPKEWMGEALNRYSEISDSNEYFSTFYGDIARKTVLDAANEYKEVNQRLIDRISDIPELAPYVDCLMEDADNLDSVIGVLEHGSYEQASLAVMEFSKVTLKKAVYDDAFKKSIQESRNSAFEKFKKTRQAFFGCDYEKIKLAACDCKKVLATLFELVSEIDMRFSQEKRDRGIVDFSDAERFAFKLFVNDILPDGKLDITPVAKKYRDSFVEIYIDEYQDINPIQDMIFRAICRYDENGHETNRFMVGDVKQSIYRFRGARPELFASYLDSFVPYEEPSCREHKEYLSNNFRCSRSVVDFTNLVFDRIMKEHYKDEDKLVYSRNEDYSYTDPCKVVIFEDEEDNDYYDSEIKVCAKQILEVVNNPAYISSSGKMFGYGDVAVLLPTPKKVADKYAKYFELCGIPTYSEITENFFENAEIMLCMCLLNTIDNSLRDIYVTGAMRSEIFAFTDDDLLSIRRLCFDRAVNDLSMWQSVKLVAESEDAEEFLRTKCRLFVEVIEKFKRMSVGMSSDKLLLKLYSELHLMNVVSDESFNRYTDNSHLRRDNLMILYNLARNFEKSSFRGLSSFLDYLNDRAEKPESVRAASASDGTDAVRIMSIHRSKGLEFPVCILCGLSNNFNRADEQQRLIVSDENGIGFKLRDIHGIKSCDSATGVVSYDTPFRAAVKAGEVSQLTEEQKRVLYVGMTRAKDMLIMMLKKPDESALMTYYENSLKGANKIRANGFYDWIYTCICGYSASKALLENTDCDINTLAYDESNCFEVVLTTPESMYKNTGNGESLCNDTNDTEELAARISAKLSYKYPYNNITNIPTKISVSDLKKSEITQWDSDEIKELLEVPGFLKKPRYSAAEKGTAMHMFMQFANYGNCESSVEKEARRLLESGYLSGEQFACLDYSKLNSFFKSDIYDEIKNACNVYREKAFTLSTDISQVYGNLPHGNETMLVQGKIDCFFESADGTYTVIDFKSDKVNSPSELSERYGLQLEYYKKAVSEMTGCSNVKTMIYSFELAECFEI